MDNFFQELKRRNVLKVAAIYLAAAWLLIQVADVMAPALQMPDWTLLAVIIVISIGFPISIVVSWMFDITTSGFRRDDEIAGPQAIGSILNNPNARRQSIAFLPIVNLSNEVEQEYFADGLTEDIITDLSQVPELLVLSRTAVFGFKKASIEPREVGKSLNANLILQGTVRKDGGLIRVTSQLTNVATGDNVWSKRYDRDLNQIFTVQDELTREIVTALEVELVAGEQGKHRRSKFKSADAGHLLYKGRFYFFKYDRDSNLIARSLFKQFIEMEPDSVLGYVWVGYTWQFALVVGWADSMEAVSKIGEYVAKSLEIDSTDPQSLVMDSYFQTLAGNLTKAIESAELAVKVSPSMDDAYRALGWAKMFDGEPKVAIDNFKRAERLCPVLGAVHLGMIGTAYRNAGQLDEAVVAFEECIDRYPEFYSARVGLVSALSMQGDTRRAKEELKLILRDKPGYTVAQYTAQNFYRDKSMMDKWGESLRVIGLPEKPEP